MRRIQLCRATSTSLGRRSFVEFDTGVRSRRLLGWNVAPRTCAKCQTKPTLAAPAASALAALEHLKDLTT